MKEIEIKSFYGDYKVHLGDEIDYKNIIKSGDIVVCDKKVFELYKDELDEWLNNDNAIFIKATEEQKSYRGVETIINVLIEKGFHKNSKLVAIGGGITQDVVAFISSILFRGVYWELIPTTLLAQCDSCIGSKTSINFGDYKNQVGGFYPPRNVYIAPHFLKTLSEKEMRSGLGEMLHYFVVGGREDFEFFSDNCTLAISDTEILMSLIKRSLKIKKSYIEIDEYDKNERQILNYGHSFGHAIESFTDYRVPHGIAVSHGIDIANYISVKLGLLSEEKRERIKKVASLFWEEDDLKDFRFNRYMNFLRKDKKNSSNRLGIILCNNFGDLSKHMVEADDRFTEMLSEYFREAEQ